MKPSLICCLFIALVFSPLHGFGGKNDDPTSLVFPSFLHTFGIRKATRTHLRIYTRNRVRVRDPQGIAAVRLESWDDPNHKKDDDKVTGYGIDAGSNIIVYNTSMRSLSVYGLNEKGIRALRRPTAVTASPHGDVYVTDTGNHRIVRFFNPKKKLEFVRAIGSEGALPGQFQSPTGIAMDSQGMVYISDTANHRVQLLRPDDTLHLWFGNQGVEDGELWHPAGIAVTDKWHRWSYYRDSFIVLVDLDNRRIQKFTLEGKFLQATRLRDFGFSKGHLAYLAIDYYSNIWVTDTANHCIHKFDRNLNYLTSFGKQGSGDREFNEPRGIAIYRRFGQVFVAERESAQYYWIGTDIVDFESRIDSLSGIIRLDFFLTEPSFLSLTSKDVRTGEKREIFQKQQYFSGRQTIYVDGEWRRISPHRYEGANSNGDDLSRTISPTPPGEYELQLKVEPTYSSYKYFSKEVSERVLVR